MKYRKLTLEELEDTKDSFVRFLASNGIDKDEWLKIKNNKSSTVNSLIEQFSDLVFEQVISNVELLQFTEPKEIKIFKCEKDKIILAGLSVKAGDLFDFSKIESQTDIIEMAAKSKANLSVFKAEKPYKPNRSTEIFNMMEAGCKIQKDPFLYNTIMNLNLKSN